MRAITRARTSGVWLFLAFCLAIHAGFLPAQTPPAKAGPSREAQASGSRILGDHIAQSGDQITARGRVRVFYRDLVLTADYVEMNTTTRDALAEGHVTLTLPTEIISAELMAVNLDTALGRMEGAFGLAQPSLIYSADRVERISEDVYKMGRNRFTLCSQAVPRWAFSSAKANLKKNDYVELWGATFTIKKIPVFYFPYIKYPLAQERASGLLIPQIGYSGVKGFSLSQSYYWAIARNQDATFTLDYYGAKGIGGGVEYRYLFGSADKTGAGGLIRGQAQLYYFSFRAQEDGTTPEPAYLVRWNHNQNLPGGFSLTADVDYQTSFDFLREFDNNFKRAVVSNRRSQVFLSRTWRAFNLSVRASQFETYFNSIDNAIISRSLPQITLTMMRAKVLGPVFFSLSSTYNNWQYGWRSQYEAGTQLKNQSINFAPVLSLPWTSTPWMTVNTSLSGNINYFFTSYDSDTDTIVDVPFLAANYSFEISAIGPVFYRIFNFGKRVADPQKQPKIKHLIEPSVTYQYQPPWVDPERIVAIRPYRQNHVLTYGLTNRLFYKSTGAAKEVFTWGLTQTYYIAPYESLPNQYVIGDWLPAGTSLRFSDITTFIRFYPGAKASLDYAASYNTYKQAFAQNRLAFSWGLPQDDLYFRLSWYLSVNPWYSGTIYDRHQVSAAAGFKFPSLNLDALAEIDYNVRENKLLYVAGSFVYHYQCIDFRLESRLFYYRDEPEFQIRFSFDLGGVGKSTDFLGGSRYD